jgi:hypothetical protein
MLLASKSENQRHKTRSHVPLWKHGFAPSMVKSTCRGKVRQSRQKKLLAMAGRSGKKRQTAVYHGRPKGKIGKELGFSSHSAEAQQKQETCLNAPEVAGRGMVKTREGTAPSKPFECFSKNQKLGATSRFTRCVLPARRREQLIATSADRRELHFWLL